MVLECCLFEERNLRQFRETNHRICNHEKLLAERKRLFLRPETHAVARRIYSFGIIIFFFVYEVVINISISLSISPQEYYLIIKKKPQLIVLSIVLITPPITTSAIPSI
jgi:hypothetical protein